MDAALQTRSREAASQAQGSRDLFAGAGVVVARCRARSCGAVTVLDLSPGLRAVLQKASLARLEDALRCTCGARGGVFAASSAELPADKSGHRLFLFRV